MELKKKVLEKLKSHNIILWGRTEQTRYFYEKYGDELHCKACIAGSDEHPEYYDMEKKCVPIIKWSDYTYTENDYIVIFAFPFAPIVNQLQSYGLCNIENFVVYNLAYVVLEQKKVVILSGNCHMTVIYQLLSQIEEVREKYFLFHFPTNSFDNRWAYMNLSYMINLCDFYICTYHDKNHRAYFEKEELPRKCKIITIPCGTRELYWPQLETENNRPKNEFLIRKRGEKRHGPFDCGDLNINKMIKEGKTLEEVLERVSAEDFYTKQEVEKHINDIFRQIEEEETFCDIKLLPYIRENYQKSMLYKDIHMKPMLLWRMVQGILQILNVKDNEEVLSKVQESQEWKEYCHHCTEVPVYPSVAKHMGLEWYRKETTYEVTFYNGTKRLTFEEYIRSYYYVCSREYQIMNEW